MTFLEILGTDRYTPSTASLASDPILKMFFAGGWLGIFLGCTALAGCLIYRWKEHITMNPRAVVIFAVVFFLLGLSSLMSMVTIFLAVYRLKVVIVTLTAFIVITCAGLTFARLNNVNQEDD